jgi:hypothetical protein
MKFWPGRNKSAQILVAGFSEGCDEHMSFLPTLNSLNIYSYKNDA